METEFVDALTKLASFTYAAQLSHFNVTGEGGEFYSLHLMFQHVYEMSESHIDKMSEQARASKIEIPAKMFHDVPELEWSTGTELVTELYGVAEEVCEALDKLHEKADDESEYGVLNLVESAMTDFRNIKYLLGSSCGKM
jgi:DNA-binding ferritin-like protein